MDKIITLEMIDSLNYDVQEGLQLTEPSKWKRTKDVHKLIVNVTNTYPLEELVRQLYDKMDILVRLEVENNCTPENVAKKVINKAISEMTLDGIDFDPEILRKEALGNRIYAHLLQYHSVKRIFRAIFYTLVGGFSELCITYDAPRITFINFILFEVMKCTKKDIEILPKGAEESIPPHLKMFVFQSSDLDTAAYNLLHSFEDVNNEKTIKTVYVQESCVDRFCKKLENGLRPYPEELHRDEFFIERYRKVKEMLNKLQAPTLKPSINVAEGIVPIICREFDLKYFPNFSPIAIMKIFRTTKEAIALADQDKTRNAIIWCDNLSVSYEIVHSLNCHTFLINCLEKDSKMLKKLALLSNITGSEKAFKIMGTSGVSFENGYHFEYIHAGGYSKLICFPFGVTYAN